MVSGSPASPPADQPVSWIDNHCHLPDGPEAVDIVDEALADGIVALVVVGTDRPSSLAAIAHAAAHPTVSATAGLHPHDAVQGFDSVADLVSHPSVVAVGEAGLDYHYDHSPRDLQRQVFARHIEAAHELDRPLVVHSREAWDDTFHLLDTLGWPRRTVLHCFTGGLAEAERCVASGAHLSFSGIVTFPSAADVRAAAAWCPAERLMVETDSPYLAPVPRRGKRNRPAWVRFVGEEVARLRDQDPADVAASTVATTRAFYGLAWSSPAS